MQQHMGIFLVSLALIVGFIAYFISTHSNVPKAKEDSIEGDKEPEIGQLNSIYGDEIIAVRKIEQPTPAIEDLPENKLDETSRTVHVLHVMAKSKQTFKGYELLQALLSQGLRFGEMAIFHRYQQTNGKGPVMFSLTSAVEPGTFDIHNMGRCSCPGLTLFMTSSGRSNVDVERFTLMLETAKNIARELGGECLDQHRVRINDKTLEQYTQTMFKSEKCNRSENMTHTGVA